MSSKVLLEPIARVSLFEQMADYLEDYSIIRDGDGYHATIRIANELRNWSGALSSEFDATLTNTLSFLTAYSRWLIPSRREWRNEIDPVLGRWLEFNKAFQQFQLEVEAIQTDSKDGV